MRSSSNVNFSQILETDSTICLQLTKKQPFVPANEIVGYRITRAYNDVINEMDSFFLGSADESISRLCVCIDMKDTCH